MLFCVWEGSFSRVAVLARRGAGGIAQRGEQRHDRGQQPHRELAGERGEEGEARAEQRQRAHRFGERAQAVPREVHRHQLRAAL